MQTFGSKETDSNTGLNMGQFVVSQGVGLSFLSFALQFLIFSENALLQG